MAGGGFFTEFCEEITCPVCLEYFTDPVTTECGHNFCRACLARFLEEPGRHASCPQCREPVRQSSLKPNRQLANIVEISKKFSLQDAKGTGGEGGVCKTHREPLKLFCRDHEAPICVVCDKAKEHKKHRVIPAEEAAEEYKEQIHAQQQLLEEQREKLVEQKTIEKKRSQEYLKHLEEEKQKITSVFKEMHRILEEKERFWLKHLAGLEKEIKKRQDKNMTRLSQEISHFSDLIKDVEVKSQQPLPEFLQDIRSTLSRCQEGQVRQQLELSPGLDWRLRSDSRASVLKKAMKKFEESLKQALSEVSVTLDPGTANPHLVLSKEQKTVKCGKNKQKLPDNPERFNVEFCVLGCERFTSGRHFWEVEVEEEVPLWNGWAVGVARESLRRKGRICLRPNEGIWALQKDLFRYSRISGFPLLESSLLDFRPGLRKIRVFLDYEEGRVEFFDADTDNLIFTFPPASFFEEAIRPFFWMAPGVSLKY